MYLTALPSELLFLILDQLGPEFFREDIGRLAICKTWYHHAWPIFVRDLELTEKSVIKFTKNDETWLSRIQGLVQTIHLSLEDSGEHPPFNEATSNGPIPSDSLESQTFEPSENASPSDLLIYKATETSRPSTSASQSDFLIYENEPTSTGQPSTPLDLALNKIVSLLHQSASLRAISFILKPHIAYVQVPSISSFYEPVLYWCHLNTFDPDGILLTKPQITSLEFDISGDFMPQPQQNQPSVTPNPSSHRCLALRAMLPSLRRLRCRMDTVCPALLDVSPDDKVDEWKLQDLIINLYPSVFSLESEYRRPAHSVTRLCKTLPSAEIDPLPPPRPSQDDSYAKLYHVEPIMQTSAANLAARLSNPKMVRVIYCGYPGLNMAYDALNKRFIKLKWGAAWDADGEVVGEDDESGSDGGRTSSVSSIYAGG